MLSMFNQLCFSLLTMLQDNIVTFLEFLIYLILIQLSSAKSTILRLELLYLLNPHIRQIVVNLKTNFKIEPKQITYSNSL